MNRGRHKSSKGPQRIQYYASEKEHFDLRKKMILGKMGAVIKKKGKELTKNQIKEIIEELNNLVKNPIKISTKEKKQIQHIIEKLEEIKKTDVQSQK